MRMIYMLQRTDKDWFLMLSLINSDKKKLQHSRLVLLKIYKLSGCSYKYLKL